MEKEILSVIIIIQQISEIWHGARQITGKNPRVFYIGPVHDPSVRLENDFLVFFSPLRREHGVGPEYLKKPEECFDKVDREITFCK